MRRFRPVPFLLTLLVAAGALPALPLDPSRSISQYTHEVWTAEDGLPQNSIQALIQDRTGYLWIGTQEGLVRFDGDRFTVYDPTNTPGLRSGDIRALIEDRGGNLWAGTGGGGLTCILGGGGTKTYTTREGLAHDRVLALCEGSQGEIWAGTEEGLSLFEGGRAKTVALPASLPSMAVRVVREDSSGAIWVGTAKGLCRIVGGRAEAFSEEDGLKSLEVQGIYEDSKKTLWVCTRGGLHRFDGRRFTAFTRKDGLPHDIVWTALEDRHGSLWVGTSAGLCRFKPGACETFAAKDGLSYDLVWNLMEDAEGSLWVGTSSFGLNRFKDGKFVTYGTREGLSAEYAWCVAEDRGGSIWVGTDLGGLNRIRDGKVTLYGEEDGLCFVEVGALCEDHEGRLWVGTPRGISLMENGRFRTLGAKEGLLSEWIRCIVTDREGSVWVGTHGGGLARWTGRRFDVLTKGDGLSSDYIRTVLQGRDGSLWVGTNGGGLNRIRDGKIEVLRASKGLRSEFIYALHEDAGGGLWIGTAGGGICRYKGGRFASATTAEGLFSDLIFCILEDGSGRLWMSCNKGVFSVSRKELEEVLDGKRPKVACDVYGREDGMRSAECNGGLQPAGCKGADGRFWFPTIKGVVVVDPARLNRNLRPPPVVIEEVQADGHPIPPGQPATLPPKTGRVSFHYTALSLLGPSKVRFRYRLEPVDPDWIETGDRRTASYANLRPGNYVFRLMACNNDGVWNETGASFAFRQRPQFVQTLPFRTLLVLSVLAVIWGGLRWRTRRMRRRQEDLERMVEERTSQLNDANRELERLALVDSLTGIANHRALHAFLEREWRRAQRMDAPITILMADLDWFKAFNDLYGHLGGDECLRKVGRVFQSVARRPTDLAARWGGEEFTLVLSDTEADGAAKVAEEVRRGVEGLAIPHAASAVGPVVTISLGATVVYPSRGSHLEDALRAADNALYESKKAGRNRVTFG